eukprot:CAMPEP_0204072922 /NCGR_PEP_ID=MMETSP0360-20130528/162480_1 /ASSEMBLY_ACC=CAM_ASM_000342 /TAXON_ID=268821 /ORGANISM="Scrippsiella Hangoei, Strain SHTV-5" /LENGTH=69 /DNA_ID=CAMNT_0051021283 /DNA_START=38 /DNA_END=244 /DNA_ORIENTATION=+
MMMYKKKAIRACGIVEIVLVTNIRGSSAARTQPGEARGKARMARAFKGGAFEDLAAEPPPPSRSSPPAA